MIAAGRRRRRALAIVRARQDSTAPSAAVLLPACRVLQASTVLVVLQPPCRACVATTVSRQHTARILALVHAPVRVGTTAALGAPPCQAPHAPSGPRVWVGRPHRRSAQTRATTAVVVRRAQRVKFVERGTSAPRPARLCTHPTLALAHANATVDITARRVVRRQVHHVQRAPLVRGAGVPLRSPLCAMEVPVLTVHRRRAKTALRVRQARTASAGAPLRRPAVVLLVPIAQPRRL